MLKVLSSRTVLTALAAFFVAGFQAVEAYFDPQVYMLIMGVLTFLVGYFRINTRVNFED